MWVTGASWSPAGDAIVLAYTDCSGSPCGDVVAIMDRDGAITNLTDYLPGRSDTNPRWSPDGSRILFSRSLPNDPLLTLHTIAPDGSSAAELALPFESPVRASWSPDGERLVLEATVTNASGLPEPAIFTVGIDGGNPVRISPAGNLWGRADWSPDGSAILIALQAGLIEEAPNQFTAYAQPAILSPDAIDWRWLLTNQAHETSAVWSPDGLGVIYVRDIPTGHELSVVSASGADRRVISVAGVHVSGDTLDWGNGLGS